MAACSARTPSSGSGPEAMAPSRSAVEPLPAFGAVFSHAQDLLPGPDLRPWRRASYERFVEQGIPTVRAEDWKYTGSKNTSLTQGVVVVADIPEP